MYELKQYIDSELLDKVYQTAPDKINDFIKNFNKVPESNKQWFVDHYLTKEQLEAWLE